MNRKQTMRPGRLLIHSRLPHCPVLKPHVHIPLHFWLCLYDIHRQILHKHTLVWRLLQLHSCLCILSKQVVYLFVINLYKTASHQMLLLSLRICQCDYLVKRPRYDTHRLFILCWTHHCMSLTAACLSICEYCPVVSFKNIIHKGKCSLLVNLTLQRLYSKYRVKTKYFRRFSWACLEQFHLLYRGINLYNVNTTFIRIFVPRYFSFVLIGLHLTITFTASVILNWSQTFYSRNFKFL